MSDSMVERKARSILLHLEALIATPLVDTRPISLVDFTLDSSDLDTSPETKTSPQHRTKSPPRRRLFDSPGDDAPETAEDVLNLVDEELGGLSLRTSSPLQSCPHAAADGAKKSRTEASFSAISATGSGDAASSEVLVSHDQATPCGVGDDDSAPPKSPLSATVKDGTFVLDEDGAVGTNDLGVASPDDSDLNGPPPLSLPALGESFVIARDCSPTGDADGQDHSPTALDTTFTTSPAAAAAAKQA
ncbi:hypothetical protein MTO96_045799 [Rhipicephalus appendiculatus]